MLHGCAHSSSIRVRHAACTLASCARSLRVSTPKRNQFISRLENDIDYGTCEASHRTGMTVGSVDDLSDLWDAALFLLVLRELLQDRVRTDMRALRGKLELHSLHVPVRQLELAPHSSPHTSACMREILVLRKSKLRGCQPPTPCSMLLIEYHTTGRCGGQSASFISCNLGFC